MSSNTTSSDTSFWDRRRGVVRSSKGGWIIGKGVFNHGYSMMDDLVGHVSYMQVIILNATGRLPERRLADWFEAIHICLSWPDPRIWCNQIGALGGTAQTSVVAATTAGILSGDSRSYATKSLIEGAEFIQNALKSYRRGISIDDILKEEFAKHGGKPFIMGYARPIAKGDERVEAMTRTQESLELSLGEHQQLASEIENILHKKFDESMNINGYISAFLSDRGFTAQEIYRIFAVLITSGVTACYADTRDKPAESFLPLRCDDIKYRGRPQRSLP